MSFNAQGLPNADLATQQDTAAALSSKISPGWTSIVSEDGHAQGGNHHDLFYNRTSGAAASVLFNSAGDDFQTAWSGNFNPGWTTIAQTDCPNLLLFYNANSGVTVGVRFDASGGKPVSLGGYVLNAGWTTVTNIPTQQDNFLELFYNSHTGIAAVGWIDCLNGSYHQTESQAMTPGWQIITRAPATGQELFYNPSGAAAITNWDKLNATIHTLGHFSISPGWTNIVAMYAGDAVSELFYNSSSRQAVVEGITPSGTSPPLHSYADFGRWNIITRLENGSGQLLFYK